MDENEEIFDNAGQPSTSVNTSTYKAATITVDISKYQNMKLYSSFSMATENATKELDRKIWADRGKDLNYGLKACMRRMAKLEEPELKISEEDKVVFENPISVLVRKSCEITVEVLKTQNQYQSAKFSSGKEWSIEYRSEEERKKLEAEKWDEVAEDLESCMKIFFDALGKKTDAPEKFSELCRQKLETKKQEAVVESVPPTPPEKTENKKELFEKTV